MSASRAARTPCIAILCFTLILGAAPAAAASEAVTVPNSIAAVGDSITQAASSDGDLGVDAPRNSWSTGTNETVNSHYLRLRSSNATITAYNHSVSGAKVGNLADQMTTLSSIQPDYLTVLIGGNDLCTDTIEEMTPVADFRAQFTNAMVTLLGSPAQSGVSPDTDVYVVSIPDIHQLWELFKNNFFARSVWSAGNICQSLLKNPTSNQQADVERRAAFRQRNIDFNTQLAEVCAQFMQCLFDANAVFDARIERSDVAGDYFHPSIAGQGKLSAVSWSAGYTWNATTPPATEDPADTMVVQSLEGTSTSTGRNTWSATVTITVVDSDGAGVGQATVSGSWSVGAGETTCVTEWNGQCELTSDNLNKRKVSEVTFTVTDVAHLTLHWDKNASVTSTVVHRPT